jgi:hypothetical protein
MTGRTLSDNRADTEVRVQGEAGSTRLLEYMLVSVVALSYLFFSLPHKRLRQIGDTTELYALLARSFSHGKIDLPVEPRPELLSLSDPYDPVANNAYRLQDASLYKGRYYLYFGAVPAAVLFLPYHLLTGRDLANRVAVPIFAIGGYLSSCALFFLLTAHNQWILPLWLRCVIVVSLGSTSLVYLLLARPSFYEVAIAAGYCCVMAGFLELARALLIRGAPNKRRFLAGLLFGLAVGCRPHLVVVCGVVVAAAATGARWRFRPLTELTFPMLLCAVLLGWYNYARFDNALEFGKTYQLATFVDAGSTYSGLRFDHKAAVWAAKNYLFVPPRVDRGPRFFHAANAGVHNGAPDWKEPMVGLIPVDLFAALGLFTPLLLWRRWKCAELLDKGSAWLLFVMYSSGILVFLFVSATGWVLGRYLTDFAPLLTFVGASLAALIWQMFQPSLFKYTFSGVIAVAAIYGTAVCLALTTPNWDLILRFLCS